MRQLPPARAIGTSWHDRRPSGVCLLRPDPLGDLELHSAAECFVAQMRIRDLRVRILRDGHEPNEAEEQRPCCVPIEPVHVISSPKDRREQEGYQNSGSFGEKSWGDFADINPLSFGREAIVAKHGHALPYRMAIITGLAIHQHHRRAFSILRHLPDSETPSTRSSNSSTCAKDLGHHATSSRSNTRRGLGAWIASSLFRTALSPQTPAT